MGTPKPRKRSAEDDNVFDERQRTLIVPHGSVGWEEHMLQIYASGKFDVNAMVGIRVTKRRFEDLYNSDDTFKMLVEYGRTLSEAYWHAIPSDNILNRNVNATLFSMVMKNKFGWAEKTEIKATKDISEMSKEELEAELLQHTPTLKTLVDNNTREIINVVG
jgi:hypothetical protein